MKIIKATLLSVFLVSPVQAIASEIVADMYKSPYCGCCDLHADHLEEHGFKVNIIETLQPVDIKEEYGIPESMRSCHTTKIDGYVFEGHIHANSIKKFLEERPSASGLAVPGMPIGSPGMPGNRSEEIKVFALEESISTYLTGEYSVYDTF